MCIRDSVEVGSLATPDDALGIAVAGSYAYVADYAGGLRVVSITDPAAPVEVAFYDTPGATRRVALAGDLIYVADGDHVLVILRFDGDPNGG